MQEHKQPTEIKNEKAELPFVSTGVEPASAETNKPIAQDPAKCRELQKAVDAIKDDPKKAAKAVHTAVNFGVIHLMMNSALSLWITYNIVPWKSTQSLLHSLAEGFKPVVASYDKIKQVTGIEKLQNYVGTSLGFKEATKITEEMRNIGIQNSARSFVETAVMCIAGSVILAAVLPWENNSNSIVNWVDDLIHPGKKKKREATLAEAKEKGLQLPPEEPQHKETLGNLLKIRALALVPIFGIDGIIQGINNSCMRLGKPSLETFLWDKGAKMHDWLSPTTRNRWLNFFSSKGQTIESIQPLVREALEKTVGSNTGRMMFSEQFRMFSKEIYLTAIYTGFLYLLGKTPVIPWTLSKLGFNKEQEHKIEDAIESDVGLNVLPFNDTSAKSISHSAESKEEAPVKFTKRISSKTSKSEEHLPKNFQDRIALKERLSDSHREQTPSLA